MPPLENAIDEAERILDVAEHEGVTLRLFGGLAFYFRCESARKYPSLRRTYADMDLVGHLKQSGNIRRLFAELGYVPRERFNALYGEQRLIFNDVDLKRRVDVFLDVFRMCHKFDFKKTLELDRLTIPLADLLATKLQIVQITEKDFKDIISVLVDHDVGDGDEPETINGRHLANLCSDDWGVYKTFTMNIARTLDELDGWNLEEDVRSRATEKCRQLMRMIEGVPKSFKWKTRAWIGERVRWYQIPEVS